MLTLENVSDGEQVHQRCVLVAGKYTAAAGHAVHVSVRDEAGKEIFPTQHWPLSAGHFKALVLLSPGINVIGVAPYDHEETTFRLNYIPLIQTPPLHLAILVARDSPLEIDCPPIKHGHVSSTHSSLEAAIAKFRMTAYMWQALTAEDLRAKGLGRRAFRLDERWGHDTTSQEHLHSMNEGSPKMHSTAHVHIIRTDKTVVELRDMQRAQQNPNGRNRDDLHRIFSDALKAAGGESDANCRPVVAGMILDSHYSTAKDLVLGHAALGSHNPKGLSLGIMGSHLTYSWPRFLEEVPNCLLDEGTPGDTVCNDNGECLSLWEACAVGQGAFLHEVGHAFSAPHTSGIMARGYSQNWPKCFLSRTAFSRYLKADGIAPVNNETPNACSWDIRDAMRFINLPHFEHPADLARPTEAPTAEIVGDEGDDDDFLCAKVECSAGIAQAWLNGKLEHGVSLSEPCKILQYTLDELESRFDRCRSLNLEVLCMNGIGAKFDLWRLFAESTTVRVPGTCIRLRKQSVADNQASPDKADWAWTVMLKKRSEAGPLVAASKIDLRVGCSLDGAIVYYKDGTTIPCGPRGKPSDGDPCMGGHQSRKIALPRGDDIAKVFVSRTGDGTDYSNLRGLRMVLTSGRAMGALNRSSDATVTCLKPPTGHRVIGFFGRSGPYGMCHEFGIISAPKDAELPDSMYDLPELQNIDGRSYQTSGAHGGKRGERGTDGQDSSEDEEISEDEDDRYDHSDDNREDDDEDED